VTFITNQELSPGFRNLLFQAFFYKMSCLLNFGTWLVIVIISISHFLSKYLLIVGILIPVLGSRVKNKQRLHSRQLASYLVYGSEGVVRV
jgi:hypothetical protein